MLTENQQEQVLNIIQQTWSDAIICSIEFGDLCGCFSEITLDPCYLDIEVKSNLLGQDYAVINNQRRLAEDNIVYWACNKLSWSGCEWCDYELRVDLRLIVNISRTMEIRRNHEIKKPL